MDHPVNPKASTDVRPRKNRIFAGKRLIDITFTKWLKEFIKSQKDHTLRSSIQLNGVRPQHWNAQAELVLICIKLGSILDQKEKSSKQQILFAISTKVSRMIAFQDKRINNHGPQNDYHEKTKGFLSKIKKTVLTLLERGNIPTQDEIKSFLQQLIGFRSINSRGSRVILELKIQESFHFIMEELQIFIETISSINQSPRK